MFTLDGDVYTLDPAGNRSMKQDDRAGVTTTYGYDPIYELLSATQGGTTTESYSYDPVGNRTASLAIPSYTVNTSNELTSDSNASYTYDYNGNTLTKVASAGTTSYSWDFENRLTSVTLPNSGGTVTFKYDPFGRRIEKVSPTATSIFAYDGDNVIETTNAVGAIISKYAQGQNINEPLAESTAGTTSFYEQDGLGSVTSLSSSAGALANTYTYDSFGKLTNSSGTLTNPFQYTGREFDSETGLYYYRARYYDPGAGRFLSEDPIAFKGDINFYAYVENDPTLFNDPSGMQHSPGGPWHPAPGVKFACKGSDDCATLSWKIDLFKRLISDHAAWDLAHNTTRHADDDIPNLLNGLDNCIAIHRIKCTNKGPCKVPEPTPQPNPVPDAKPMGAPLLPLILDLLEDLGWAALAGAG